MVGYMDTQGTGPQYPNLIMGYLGFVSSSESSLWFGVDVLDWGTWILRVI